MPVAWADDSDVADSAAVADVANVADVADVVDVVGLANPSTGVRSRNPNKIANEILEIDDVGAESALWHMRRRHAVNP